MKLIGTTGDAADKSGRPAATDPRFRYLRAQVEGYPPSMLVLGYVDQSPEGPVEVWYSASREIIKLLDGRIIATGGLPMDWSTTRFEPLPTAWPLVGPGDVAYRRSHDESARYRTGLVDDVLLHPWSGELPQALIKSLPATLPIELARSYRWFHESYTRVPPWLVGANRVDPSASQPEAWFAWGRHLGQDVLVYSYQCLKSDFCLKLQRWPLQEELH